MDRELLLERLGPVITYGKRYWPLALGGLFVVVLVVSVGYCWTGGKRERPIHTDLAPRSMTLRCPMFRDGNTIPTLYTYDGTNISPPLEILAVPEGTRELALILEDASDASAVFWVLYRLPPDLTAIGEAIGSDPSPVLLRGGMQGTNSFGAIGYHGPNMPGRRYKFTLYALHTPLEESVKPGLTADELRPLLQGRTQATATLTGSLRR